jgi:hypothetical protein
MFCFNLKSYPHFDFVDNFIFVVMVIIVRSNGDS